MLQYSLLILLNPKLCSLAVLHGYVWCLGSYLFHTPTEGPVQWHIHIIHTLSRWATNHIYFWKHKVEEGSPHSEEAEAHWEKKADKPLIGISIACLLNEAVSQAGPLQRTAPTVGGNLGSEGQGGTSELSLEERQSFTRETKDSGEFHHGRRICKSK